MNTETGDSNGRATGRGDLGPPAAPSNTFGVNPQPAAGMSPPMPLEWVLLEHVSLLVRQAREMATSPSKVKVCKALELAEVWLRAATGRI